MTGPRGGGLVAVHAHPDDETLSTGALIAAWARSGRPVTVVTCTRGERGEVIDTPAHPTGAGHLEGDGPALAAHREGELAAALRALGDGPEAVEHLFLDAVPVPGPRVDRFVDSGMAWVAPGVAGPAPDAPPAAFCRVTLDEAARRLATVLRERRPGVVATYEPGGGYGHPDHVRTHEVTVRALALAADPAAPVVGAAWEVPELWESVATAGAVRAARRALASDPAVRDLASRAGLTFPDPDEALPPVAREAADLSDDATTSVDVRPVLDRVLAAMRAHATQVQHAGAWGDEGGDDRGDDAHIGPDGPAGPIGRYALSNAVLAPILAIETYRRVSPTATGR